MKKVFCRIVRYCFGSEEAAFFTLCAMVIVALAMLGMHMLGVGRYLLTVFLGVCMIGTFMFTAYSLIPVLMKVAKRCNGGASQN